MTMHIVIYKPSTKQHLPEVLYKLSAGSLEIYKS